MMRVARDFSDMAPLATVKLAERRSEGLMVGGSAGDGSGGGGCWGGRVRGAG